MISENKPQFIRCTKHSNFSKWIASLPFHSHFLVQRIIRVYFSEIIHSFTFWSQRKIYTFSKFHQQSPFDYSISTKKNFNSSTRHLSVKMRFKCIDNFHTVLNEGTSKISREETSETVE